MDNTFRFNIIMRGYSYIANIINERQNNVINLDLSSVKKYLSFLKKESILMDDKIKIYKEKAQEKLKEKEKKLKDNKIKLDEYKKEKNKILEKIQNIENQILKNENLSKTILSYKTNILQNKSFLIPIERKDKDRIYLYQNYTNVCDICKFNCHLNCNHYFQIFCIGINCKNCPNKCPSSSHEISKYKYPNFDYRSIDDILLLYKGDSNTKISQDLKIKKTIDKIKENNTLLKNSIEILKNNIIDIEKKEKIIYEYNINNDEDFIDIIEMNKKINEEIEAFNFKNLNEIFDREKLDLISELLIFGIENTHKEKDYSFIPEPYRGGQGGGRCC